MCAPLHALACVRGELLQDAAVLRFMRLRGQPPQVLQVSLQGSQFLDAVRDLRDVVVQQTVHVAAVLVRRIPEAGASGRCWRVIDRLIAQERAASKR
jgi:hypothetical protein